MVWPNKGLVHRPTVMGTRGMVTSAHPLASLAGLRILMEGGNAIDAAVATAAALNVVEPYMSGLGGGGVMLIQLKRGEMANLHYAGHVPQHASIETLDAQTVDEGPKASVIPGAPAGWLSALERYGTMSPATVFAPAIEYAEHGVPLSVMNSTFYGLANQRVQGDARAVYFPTGNTPGAGTIIRQRQLAQTYRTLAIDGQEAFYHGPIAKELVRSIQEAGGLMTEQDLASLAIKWIEPSVTEYRGYEVRTSGWPLTAFEIQITLNILENFDLAASGHNTADTIHTMVEAMKLSVADRINYGGRETPPPPAFYGKEYAAQRARLIDPQHAQPVEGERYTRPRPEGSVLPGNPGDVTRECTTHFDVVDSEGNAVSITQSIGAFFGSGFMAGNTGVMMNNFLFFYDLNPESPNALRPGALRAGPLAPTMLFRDGKLFLLIGTPGAYGITQTTVQMISNVVDHGFSTQAAIEAARFKTGTGRQLVIEDRVPPDVRDELTRRGHELALVGDWSAAVGGGQGILIDPETGAFSGGADPRRDGYAMGW